ncbi:hypothetical protein EJ110_NYTH38328 [Nymphaea thermarum]|nr:hypothetical protein EJ110_NYTH38328 [Nymphaea thermarum]
MAESRNFEGGNDKKGGGNLFSYGSTVKLDGHNYELWSRSFMLSVKGHRKRHIIEEDEPTNKSGKYLTWEEDDIMVMSWIMNSVQPQIASTITYYTTAKEMWEFLRETYSQDKNVSKILQVEEECTISDREVRIYLNTLPQLSRLAISMSQPAGVTPAFALAVGSGRGHGSTYSTRGRGIGRGTGGRGRFQCTYCGKIGHVEDRCWDKYGRSSSLSQGRNMVTKQGKSSTYSSMGSAQTATPTVEDSSPSIAPETVSIDRVEPQLERCSAPGAIVPGAKTERTLQRVTSCRA